MSFGPEHRDSRRNEITWGEEKVSSAELAGAAGDWLTKEVRIDSFCSCAPTPVPGPVQESRQQTSKGAGLVGVGKQEGGRAREHPPTHRN